MTGLFIAGTLALAVAIAIALTARIGRTGWEPVAAAVVIGLAGYAWQGRPDLSGHPVEGASARSVRFDEGLAERRRTMGERVSAATKWLVLSDGLARQGRTQDSANILSSAVRNDPEDANLWVGLGNALVLHGDGMLSPSAEYAFREAMRLEPDSPSPRYFYALALARSGKLEAARALWAELAVAMREGTPFRAELERNVALIDGLLARRAAQGGKPPSSTAVPD